MSDFDQYQFHMSKLGEAFAANDETEMREHWAKVEQIKNRNGGMPPKQP